MAIVHTSVLCLMVIIITTMIIIITIIRRNKHFIEPQQSYIQYLKKEEKTIHLQILKSRNNLPYIKEKEIGIVKS